MRAASSASVQGVPSPTRPLQQTRFHSAHYLAVAACLVAGVALWFTRGTLDVFGNERETTRVALLPSGPELVGLIMLVLIASAGAGAALARSFRPGGHHAGPNAGTRRNARREGWPLAVFQVSLPLFALGVLALPYLPWLPDRVPALRSLTGPMARLVWFIVLAQVGWVAWSARSSLRDAVSRGLPRAWPAAVFLASIAAFGTAAFRLTESPVFPGGDEPHYLIVMQSLWRDHDLKIENNHAREDYAEYYHEPLRPDFRARGTDGQIYSIHPIGLPLLAASVYGVGGYRGVVWFMVLVAALTATLMWRWTADQTGSVEAATFAWACVCLGAPFLFNSFAVYPEIPAAFCVMVAMGWKPSSFRSDPRAGEYRVRALAVAALPWLSTKYAPMAAALLAVLAWRGRARPRAVVALALPFVLSLCLWFSFFYWIWGSPWPSAPYGPDTQTSLATLRTGGLGLLFDQEYGVFFYAPALAIGVIGLARMWRSGESAWSARAVEIALVGGALLVTVGAFELWWGGSAPPGRPLVSGLPLLALPIAWQYRRSSTAPVLRAAYQLLLLIGIATSGVLLVADHGLLVAQDQDGSSAVLQWLSPLWQLWETLPSFLRESPLGAASHAVLWMAAALVAGWMCRRSKVSAPGGAALAAASYVGGAVLAMLLVAPVLFAGPPDPEVSPAARSRVPILDAFDATARPVAVVYNPFHLVRPSDIPPLMTLVASPDLRSGAQPVRVFLNARFALPAGEYEVEIGGLPGGQSQKPVAGTVGLQVGRIGSPLYEWNATLRPSETWRHTFTLPVDAEFVGFKTSPPLASATRLWLRPRHIVDASQRATGPPVLAAAVYGSTSLFFRNDGVYTEAAGFWLRGRSTIDATVVKADGTGAVTLKLHSGARANTVTIEAPLWRERLDLVPNVSQEVRIPAAARAGPIPLRITTSDGFVPAELSATSTDRRVLGCWVEIVG